MRAAAAPPVSGNRDEVHVWGKCSWCGYLRSIIGSAPQCAFFGKLIELIWSQNMISVRCARAYLLTHSQKNFATSVSLCAWVRPSQIRLQDIGGYQSVDMSRNTDVVRMRH